MGCDVYECMKLRIWLLYLCAYVKIILGGDTKIQIIKERSNMENVLSKNQTNKNQNEMNFLRMLDRGIDDMEAGRELPLEEAFQKISELRNTRRRART